MMFVAKACPAGQASHKGGGGVCGFVPPAPPRWGGGGEGRGFGGGGNPAPATAVQLHNEDRKPSECSKKAACVQSEGDVQRPA